MRAPSPPTLSSGGFRSDGSDLPWIVRELETDHEDLFVQWIEHVRISLPDLRSIRSVVREEDRHCYLKLAYHNGAEVPSWLVSDGTLRMLALTVLAYLPASRPLKGIYLIEEPENGIHPAELEIVQQSLTSVYDGQVLVATHSPVLVTIAELDQLLCFGKTHGGAVDICVGTEHPRLRNWRREVSLGTYLAGGVLG